MIRKYMYQKFIKYFKEYIVTTYDDTKWKQISNGSKVPDKNNLVNEEDHKAYFYKVIKNAGEVLAMDENGVFELLGEGVSSTYFAKEGDKLPEDWDVITFLDNVEEAFGYIDENKSYPLLRSIIMDKNQILVYYHSDEHLTPLLEGFIKGVSNYYKQPASIICRGCREDSEDHSYYEVTV